MSDFLTMGGYGFYVWGSYLVVTVAVIGETLAVRKRRADARRALAAHRAGT